MTVTSVTAVALLYLGLLNNSHSFYYGARTSEKAQKSTRGLAFDYSNYEPKECYF